MRMHVIFYFLLIPTLTALDWGSEIKIQVLRGRPVADGVYVNGAGPYRMLLDTGAQSNQLDSRLARTLQLNAEFRVEMVTVAGSSLVPGGRLAAVRLASVEARSQEFLFTDLEAVREISGEIQGVLGQEFLANFDYVLDFDAKRIVFGARPDLPQRIAVEVLEGRIMAIPTSIGLLVLDSGTSEAVLFRGGRGGERAVMRTASAFAEVKVEQTEPLEIGGRKYKIGLAILAAHPSRKEAGLFPARLLRAVYVSNSGRYIVPLNCEKPHNSAKTPQ